MKITPLYEAHAPDCRDESLMLTLDVGEHDGQVAIGLRRTDDTCSHRMCLLDVDEARRLAASLLEAISHADAKLQ